MVEQLAGKAKPLLDTAEIELGLKKFLRREDKVCNKLLLQLLLLLPLAGEKPGFGPYTGLALPVVCLGVISALGPKRATDQAE